MEIPQNIRELQGKRINEYRFKVQKGDALILMSDGTIHAGVGDLLNFGWLWKDIADYAVRQYQITVSAMRLAASISVPVTSCTSFIRETIHSGLYAHHKQQAGSSDDWSGPKSRG